MIIELPNYIPENIINNIKEQVRPCIPQTKQHAYNRDGRTVYISEKENLKNLDAQLNNIFTNIQVNVVADRYKPRFSSGDTGYEYHLYDPQDICHIHADGEIVFNKRTPNTALLRYASVIIHLNTIHDGGELVFPAQNKKIKTELGKVVIFPPYDMYQHYTTPSDEPREVIVSWFVYNNFTVYKN
jgi:hypothetical protein